MECLLMVLKTMLSKSKTHILLFIERPYQRKFFCMAFYYYYTFKYETVYVD